MSTHEKIDYLEFPSCDFEQTKAFFSTVFGWVFVDYGVEYMAFSREETGLDGDSIWQKRLRRLRLERL